ncbi:MAG: class I SAM-dependent methyltransferase [Pseudonocardia sp.]|jgi:SAM-dependent methyltransferase|uniref:class I SAM-dependent methyltransferase n=1 Tax=Pseudonocardia sp. TaxID=60912 RepID=UPI001AD52794|nr:class I SAM-dependent methyltransferase [Pseudonocardia sp.]MBN9099375.1 class I SAM-dependent methyltransferase [Pseudonocardia sp.]
MTSPDAASAMDDEFDVSARWTAEAVAQLGPDHALPAACRGSASPAALRWLTADLEPGSLLVDVGAGMGGPAAFAARETRAHPLLFDPMPGACRAAAELFELPTLVASAERLPLRTAAADAAWCIGVLCTIDDKPAALQELRRILPTSAPLGMLVFVRRGEIDDGPAGNTFPTDTELDRLVRDARFTVTADVDLTDLDVAPADWQERIDRVERRIEELHSSDPRFIEASDQERKITRLLTEERIAGRLLRAVAI